MDDFGSIKWYCIMDLCKFNEKMAQKHIVCICVIYKDVVVFLAQITPMIRIFVQNKQLLLLLCSGWKKLFKECKYN